MSKKRKSPTSPHRIELPLLPDEPSSSHSSTNQNLESTKLPAIIPHLDGFRGFFTLQVVISHIGFDVGRPLSTGSETIAVPGFFILSSFLLTGRLLSEFETLLGTTYHYLPRDNRHEDYSNEYTAITEFVNESASLTWKQKIKKGFVIITCYGIRRIFRIYPLLIPVAIFAPGLRGPKCSSTYKILTLESSGPCHLWTIPPEMKNYLFIPLQVISITAYKGWLIIFWIWFFVYTEISWSHLRDFHPFLRNKEDQYDLEKITRIFVDDIEPTLVQSFYPLFLYGFLIRIVYRWWDPWIRPMFERWLGSPLQLLSGTRIPFMGRISVAKAFLRTFDVMLCLGCFFGFIFMLPRYNATIHPDNIFNGPGYIVGTVLLISCLMPVDSWIVRPFSHGILRHFGKISFGWYMTHRFVATWIVDKLASLMMDKYHVELMLIIFVVSYIVALAVYYMVEKPGIKSGNWLCQRISRV